MNYTFYMKQPFGALRGTLLLVTIGFVITAYACLLAPAWIGQFYEGISFPDPAHRHLCLILGALSIVMALGSLQAFLRPLKNAGIVSLLIVTHFSIFVVDVILLAQGTPVPFMALLVEMIYLVAVCALLVRFYPTEKRFKNLEETAEVLANVVKESMKKEEKKEEVVETTVVDPVEEEAVEEQT